MGVKWATQMPVTFGGYVGVLLVAASYGTLLHPPTPPSDSTQAASLLILPKGAEVTSTMTLQKQQSLSGEERLQKVKVPSMSAGNANLGRNFQKKEAVIFDLKAEGENGSDGRHLQHLQQIAKERALLMKLQGNEGEDKFTKATLSLSRMLTALVRQELWECEVVMVYDAGFSDPAILRDLLLLVNVRQVLEVRLSDDFLNTVWASPGCRGYLLLFHNPRPLLAFADMHRDAWDYDGKYVVVGLTLPQLLHLTRTDKGRKTQHIVGAVQTGETGEWRVYVNRLYGARGVISTTTWRRDNFTSDVNLFPDKVSDLRGAQLRVVTFVWEPSIMYRRAADGSLLERYGVDIDAIALLAHAMNFSVHFDEPATGELWGRQLDDGSWNGIMGFLDRDEADIGVANMFLSYWRIQVVEFTAPYDLEMSCFLARAEPPLPRWQALAFPFQWNTWVAILLGLVGSGPLLHHLAARENTR